MFGQIKFENFEGLTKLPQKAASAWSVMEGLTGVGYKPLLYVGSQLVNGTLHWFIAERTLIYKDPVRHIIKLAILHNGEGYKLVEDSVEKIF